MKNAACGLMIAGLAMFIAYLILLVYCNSLLYKVERNHFRNSFPYNFYMDFSVRNRIVLYVLLGVSVLLTCIGEAFFFACYGNAYMMICGSFYVISLLGIGISNLLPLTMYKTHLISSTCGFFLFSMISCLFAFTDIIPDALKIGDTLSLAVLIPVGIMGFASLAALFNPKLTNWAKMEKTEVDGKTVYVKPKYNFFALYEWIFLFEMELASALFILQAIISTEV